MRMLHLCIALPIQSGKTQVLKEFVKTIRELKFGQEIVRNCGIMRLVVELGVPPGTGAKAWDVRLRGGQVIFHADEVPERV